MRYGRCLHSLVTSLAQRAFSVSRITFRPSVRANCPPRSTGGTFDIFILSGVNFMEKTISVRRTTITFSIWDLGGQSAPSPAVGLPLT